MPDGLSSCSRQVKASSAERKQSCGESRSACCGTMKPHGLRWPMEAHAARGISAKKMIRADAWTSFGWCSLQRSEEHTSELQSLMRISYAVFCLKKKKKSYNKQKKYIHIQNYNEQ